MHFQKFLASQPNCFVGLCLSANCEPEKEGPSRYEIGITTPDSSTRGRRLRALEGLRIEPGDKVLITSPVNGKEAVIIGVTERSKKVQPDSPTVVRAEPSLSGKQEIVTASRSGSIRIVSEDGRPLVDICDGETGPVIRLCGDDAQIDIPGHLKIAAGKLDLTSRRGDVRIRADEDVVVEGDIIRLN